VSDFDLTGKICIVTGAGRGIGRGIAESLARHGATVVLTGRTVATLTDAAAAIGASASTQVADVAREAEVIALRDAVLARHGRIDVLVNNAGIAPTAPSSLEVTEDLFDKTVGVDFKGPFRLSALVGARMFEAGQGSIINVSSSAAVRPSPVYPVYAGAKAALNILTQCHAMEFGPKVRVNAIQCGPFWTDIAKSWREEADRNSKGALRRIGRPEEIATTALYLASDRSSFTTGAVIQLDGGTF